MPYPQANPTSLEYRWKRHLFPPVPRPAVRGTQGPEPVLSRLHCHEPPGEVLSLNTEASDVNTIFQLMFENQ